MTGAGLGTVGLLGTAFTMEQGFYRDRLASHGLQVLIPPSDDRGRGAPHHLTSCAWGSSARSPGRPTATPSSRLVQAGAEGIVLGCTEIELLISATDSPVPVFPTTRLHVEAAVDASLATYTSL